MGIAGSSNQGTKYVPLLVYDCERAVIGIFAFNQLLKDILDEKGQLLLVEVLEVWKTCSWP